MPKSTKAISVSDQNKAWNRKSKVSLYKTETIPLNKTILIVCEGQTEQLYFESFPVLGLKVKTINLNGQTKTKLIKSTQDYLKKTGENYDFIWCVFDMDIKREDREFADFDNAIFKAKELGFEVAYSNDSFELWFYLHYNYIDSQNHRTFYYKELGKFWGFNYEKIGKEYEICSQIYDKLINDENASQEKAIKRGKKLYKEQINLPYHKQNPVTKVYELVLTLNLNLKR